MANFYERKKGIAYAMHWWNKRNPDFQIFENDCTNYVSQCLLAGGFPMEHIGQKEAGWWYQGSGLKSDSWSYSWSVAHSLRWYLASKETEAMVSQMEDASQLKPGDVICYDFDGDGLWQHNAFVVAENYRGEPLVNAHTQDSLLRYWSYLDSPAATQHMRYLFFHIHDRW